MRYSITKSVGDVWESEEFEGEANEILELTSGMEEEEWPMVDTDNMIDFIAERVDVTVTGNTKAVIKTILALELEYLKRKGIGKTEEAIPAEYIANRKATDIIAAIESDIHYRTGLSAAWAEVYDEIRGNLLEKWHKIITNRIG